MYFCWLVTALLQVSWTMWFVDVASIFMKVPSELLVGLTDTPRWKKNLYFVVYDLELFVPVCVK